MKALANQEINSLTGQLRQKAREAAKRHKASWIELGQHLQAIFTDKHYRDWGYLGFEAYCVKELGIKETTASKLVKSYAFLEKEEPKLVEASLSDEALPKTFPSYEAVNILRLAKGNKKLVEDDYAAIREAVIENLEEPQEVRKQLKTILSEKEEKAPREVRLQRRNSVIKRLVTILSSAKRELESEKMLPGSLLIQISRLIGDLEAQVE
jgi:hypothetical protein